jgi:hypothetical protein
MKRIARLASFVVRERNRRARTMRARCDHLSIVLLLLTWTAQNLSGVVCFGGSYYCHHGFLSKRQSSLPMMSLRPTMAKTIRRTLPLLCRELDISLQRRHSQHGQQLHSTIPQWDGELSDEDQDMIRMIRGPINDGKEITKPRSIIILSDTTGVTAKAAVEKVSGG